MNQELVTALRIIEREEKADEDCLLRQKQTGFLPPGKQFKRTKKQWRYIFSFNHKLNISLEKKLSTVEFINLNA